MNPKYKQFKGFGLRFEIITRDGTSLPDYMGTSKYCFPHNIKKQIVIDLSGKINAIIIDQIILHLLHYFYGKNL